MKENVKCIKDKLKNQRGSLESIVSEVGRNFLNKKRGNPDFVDFDYDLNESIKELCSLYNDDDCRYDRPTICFAYAYAFHLYRMTQWFSFSIERLLAFKKKEECDTIEIVDVGSGLGAVMWAFGLTRWASKECTMTLPKIQFYNVDNSPFQTEYARLLWERFSKIYGSCLDLEPMFLCSTSEVPLRNENTCERWLISSYFYNASDITQKAGNKRHSIPWTQNKKQSLLGVDNIDLVAGTTSNSKMHKLKKDIGFEDKDAEDVEKENQDSHPPDYDILKFDTPSKNLIKDKVLHAAENEGEYKQ